MFQSYRIFYSGLWYENPIFRLILGICSSLAVTNRSLNSLAMGLGVTFVLCCSAYIVSVLRKVIPRQVRMISYMIIVGTFTIFVDQFLKAYFPIVSKQMGPYVGLIITNCIIMGRLEAYAINKQPWFSFVDGLGCGIGYSFLLLLISFIREILGFGSLFGIQILHTTANWVIMVMPPGAFLVLGVLIWVLRTIQGPVKAK
ncbi:MAG: electron transport complex subunit RsxE [Candidatus Margulisbacteria bacterium]|nr:electron transport complex subunit RsxE [Candidatus Margulisiibacteriota bacterium]